ncbi:MAG: RNA polymerase sigma factor RpoD/SigA [bacterium]
MRQLKIKKSITSREGDVLDQYLKDISSVDLITPEQEVELAILIRKGDVQALEKLIGANLRFVVSVAKQYQNYGLPLIDLINEGNLGLLKAAWKFDETRGFKFISYAVWWIRQSIIKALADNSRHIRIPQNKVTLLYKVYKAENDFLSEYEREPTDDELSEIMNISLDEVISTRDMVIGTVSLDAPLDKSEGEAYVNRLLEPHAPWLDTELFEQVSLKSDLDRILNTLTLREQQILRLYFGIGSGHDPMTLEEIGYLIGGLSRERVRQIKDSALIKLRFSKVIQKSLLKYLAR